MRLRYLIQLAVMLKKKGEVFYRDLSEKAADIKTQKLCVRLAKDHQAQGRAFERLLLQWESLLADRDLLGSCLKELESRGLYQDPPAAGDSEKDVISYAVSQQDRIIAFFTSEWDSFSDVWKRKQVDALIKKERRYQESLIKSLGHERLGAKKYVLLVDDNPEILKVIAERLSKDGYRVVSVTSREGAIRHIGIDRPGLIFLDIMMPDVDGIQLLQEIKEIDQKIPVVMLTGVWDSAEAQKCRDLGAREYITKPLDLNQLAGLVDTVFSGK